MSQQRHLHSNVTQRDSSVIHSGNMMNDESSFMMKSNQQVIYKLYNSHIIDFQWTFCDESITPFTFQWD